MTVVGLVGALATLVLVVGAMDGLSTPDAARTAAEQDRVLAASVAAAEGGDSALAALLAAEAQRMGPDVAVARHVAALAVGWAATTPDGPVAVAPPDDGAYSHDALPDAGYGVATPAPEAPGVVAVADDGHVVAHHADGTLTVTGGRSGSLQLAAGPAQASAVAVTPTGERAAVAAPDGRVWRVDMPAGALTEVTAVPGATAVLHLAFSPAEQQLAVVAERDGAVVVALVDAAGHVAWAQAPQDGLAALTGGPTWAGRDHRGLAVAGRDAEGRHVLRTLLGASGAVLEDVVLDVGDAVPTAVRPGDDEVLVGTEGGDILAVDAATGAVLRTQAGPDGFGPVVDLSDSGTVAIDDSGRLAGWPSDGGPPVDPIALVRPAVGGRGAGPAAVVGEGWATVTVVDPAGVVRRLPWGAEAWHAALCPAAGRDLTRDERATHLPARRPGVPTCPPPTD